MQSFFPAIFFCFISPMSFSYPYIHTHTHTHKHILTHTHTYTHTQTFIHKHTQTHTCWSCIISHSFLSFLIKIFSFCSSPHPRFSLSLSLSLSLSVCLSLSLSLFHLSSHHSILPMPFVWIGRRKSYSTYTLSNCKILIQRSWSGMSVNTRNV